MDWEIGKASQPHPLWDKGNACFYVMIVKRIIGVKLLSFHVKKKKKTNGKKNSLGHPKLILTIV